jgi:hypothetical protein
MITATEHFYDDDPLRGHPDVRTRLAAVSYFFLGNGFIQAAVQFAPGGEGTPLGLLVMNPERLGKKRDALTMDGVHGLESTAIRIATDARVSAIDSQDVRATSDRLTVQWTQHHGVPAVLARWCSGPFDVQERFYCPDRSTPRLARELIVRASGDAVTHVHIRTGARTTSVDLARTIRGGGDTQIWLIYTLDRDGKTLRLATAAADPLEDNARRYWTQATHASFGDAMLDRWFNSSRFQLPAVVSHRGRIDGGVWQYNREWVRDQAFLALGLTMAGHAAEGGTILRRLLREFVTDEGATIDSSEVRSADEVELDQNGVLLYALHQYVNWTGDTHLAASAWDRVVAVAEFPLRPEFRHAPSGLLCNTREFWERHDVHGIERGFELTHQLFASLGLSSAAALARLLARDETHNRTATTSLLASAGRWERAAASLSYVTLGRTPVSLVDERGFVKRRRLDGSVQECAVALAEAQLPPSVPLAAPGEHRLNPDTSSLLPVVFGWVEPASAEAIRTLAESERLWNQAWESGGYGRYDVSSEPDSPGAWPFASLFVARAAFETGQDERVWRVLRWLDSVPGAAAGSWFEFYGPRVAPPFPQVGIIPWTWAETIFLLVHHLLGVRPEACGIRLRPRLLSGLEHVTAVLPIRGRRVHLDVKRSRGGGPSACLLDGRPVQPAGREWLIPDDNDDVDVEIVLCR